MFPKAQDFNKLKEKKQTFDNKEESTYDRQKRLCENEVCKITMDKPSVKVFLNEWPDMKLIKEIEDGGYIIKAKGEYQTDKNTFFTLTITNKTAKKEGCEDKVEKMFDIFKGFGFDVGVDEKSANELKNVLNAFNINY